MDSEVDQLHSRAKSLAARFEQGRGSSCIAEAIILDRKALGRRPPGHPKRSASMALLASHLHARYSRHGEMRDIDEAIVICRKVLDLRPPGHPDRPVSLNNFAMYLSTRYIRKGAAEDLENAIVLSREALELMPLGHPQRSMTLNNLAEDLCTRYRQNGTTQDLDNAFVLCQEALNLKPPGHPKRSSSLNNLANYLSIRYKHSGITQDLDNAIILCREALDLRPHGHPERWLSLNNLATYLYTQYNRNGAINDLDNAIILCREALDLTPSGHPDRPMTLHNFALYLATRHGRNGETEDLDNAIVLCREALNLTPPGHPYRTMPLNNLANHLSTRYRRNGATQDLIDAIVFCGKALALRPPGHPDRFMSLISFASRLSTWYNGNEITEGLDVVIDICREALDLTPSGHPSRSSSLSNLANHLCIRYKRDGAAQDLDDAIVFSREALGLTPPGNPGRSISLNNLAGCLFTLYKRSGVTEDLDSAIILCREALNLRPHGHPDRSSSLDKLAFYLSDRFRQSKRLQDKEETFSLYAQLADGTQFVSSIDLSASKSWITAAEDFQHSSLLLAYETSLRLLVQHLATFPSLPQHLVIVKNLTSSLAVDAFSACLRQCSPAKAVELLEQGRGVFWNQLTRLRSPLEDVIASGPAGSRLAAEFSRLASLIRAALDSPGADQHEQVYRLNVEMQKVVTKIREFPSLSRFLLPALFSDLQHAAKEGPVIVVNASEHSCDVLVIFLDHDPVHIPLRVTQARVRDLATELSGLARNATKLDMTKHLAFFLRKLWDQIVSPIVDFLQTTLPSRSRIWWCPTAEFSLLPLHAAGPYRKNQKNLVDIYISSYTPSLTALIRARRPNPPNVLAQDKHFIAVGQANAVGEGELLSVGAELDNIGECVNRLAAFTRIDGEDSCIARVVEELGRSEWVHLACHGIPNPMQPFESAFALRDGPFTIQRLISCELKNSEFAYLSACHTTVGYEKSPDEVIHLAAAMQFVGFRSVIGTMWAVDDGETRKITSMFYRYMVDESGCLDHTRAAYALNRTMRSVHIPLDQRILYIHIGA